MPTADGPMADPNVTATPFAVPATSPMSFKPGDTVAGKGGKAPPAAPSGVSLGSSAKSAPNGPPSGTSRGKGAKIGAENAYAPAAFRSVRRDPSAKVRVINLLGQDVTISDRIT